MDATAIAVAGLGALGLVGQAWASTRRTHKDVRDIKDSLGSKNGQGDAIAMLEFLKEWAMRHEGRHEGVEGRVAELEKRALRGE